MGETTVAKQGDPQTTAQTSIGTEGSTSIQVPKTYTREQVQKLVSDALSEQGRKHKAEVDPIITERDTLKTQIQNKNIELTDIAAEREKLQTQIDELASGDPEKFNLVKKDKELREQERKLKADRQALEADRLTHGERIKKAENLEADVLILEIAEEYENTDTTKLSDLCATLGVTSEEQIRKVADTLWAKRAEPSALVLDSGRTDGGSEDLTNLSPREKIDRGLEKLRKK